MCENNFCVTLSSSIFWTDTDRQKRPVCCKTRFWCRSEIDSVDSRDQGFTQFFCDQRILCVLLDMKPIHNFFVRWVHLFVPTLFLNPQRRNFQLFLRLVVFATNVFVDVELCFPSATLGFACFSCNQSVPPTLFRSLQSFSEAWVASFWTPAAQPKSITNFNLNRLEPCVRTQKAKKECFFELSIYRFASTATPSSKKDHRYRFSLPMR